MRSAQRAEVNTGQRFLRDKVHDSKRVVSSAAIIRDIRKLSVAGRDHFVRIIANRNARDHLQRRRIHDCESLVGFGEDEQGLGRRFNRSGSASTEKRGE